MNELPDGIYQIKAHPDTKDFVGLDLCMYRGYGYWFRDNLLDAISFVKEGKSWLWEESPHKYVVPHLTLHIPLCLVGE